MINYQLLASAIAFYKEKGYTHIDVPWLVSPEADDFTREDRPFLETNDGRRLIASGEQGIIDRLLDSNWSFYLPVNEDFMTVTPCFRCGDNKTPFHHETFMKLELAHISNSENIAVVTHNDMLENAKTLFEGILKKPVDKFELENGQVDLITYTQDGVEVELGSYGVRKVKDMFLAYGTGIALPRIQEVFTHGYHKTPIVKFDVTSPYKIVEEALEFVDASEQWCGLLKKCELADLIAAIKNNLNDHHEFNDCVKMADLTRNTFINGARQ